MKAINADNCCEGLFGQKGNVFSRLMWDYCYRSRWWTLSCRCITNIYWRDTREQRKWCSPPWHVLHQKAQGEGQQLGHELPVPTHKGNEEQVGLMLASKTSDLCLAGVPIPEESVREKSLANYNGCVLEGSGTGCPKRANGGRVAKKILEIRVLQGASLLHAQWQRPGIDWISTILLDN